tara:strand:- start:256 stop:561 length:306 start_codon:yes stop_codon:yes gene_type:complete
MKIRKGDIVKIISGNDKGKSGRVIKVFLNRERLIVEGINIAKKHSRPSQENPQGAILEKELSIHVSNVMYLDGENPTKIGSKLLENGSKVRFAKSNGNNID